MLPRVLLVPYLDGWSYDHTARAIARHLRHRFDFRIAYQAEADIPGQLEEWLPHMVIDFWWNGRLYNRFPGRVLKQVSSHRWSMLQWGKLTPGKLITKHAIDTCGLVVPSRRLHEAFTKIDDDGAALQIPVSIGAKGYEPSVLEDYAMRGGELVTGWAGNSKGKDKRLSIIVEADPSVRLADHCLTKGEMVDFYNSIDVITIASDAEGDPRPLIEAMACGCFPVTVDVGIVPELVRHEENGLIVERSADAFARAFEWCRANIRHVRAAGRQNAATMRATRTWAHVMPAWGDAIDRALAVASAPPATYVRPPPKRLTVKERLAEIRAGRPVHRR